MQQIVPPYPMIRKILGEQKAGGEAPYRLTVHCLRIGQPEGVLLYQTLTGELLLLTPSEAALLEQLPGHVSSMLAGLVPDHFLVTVKTDDMAVADQARKIAAFFRKEEKALTRYTIFTTTNCNARCFYCYQTGWQYSTMAEQTARDAAGYIAAHCGGKPVRIRWFGGEPLLNVRAIDIITSSLRQQGVEYLSTMASNGYLFDAALAQRAKADWALDEVQITLDGTEDVYNRRKAYVVAQGSPFLRVMHNIGLLLDTGVAVKVRLNMDKDNEQDLYALVDELAGCFAERTGFSVYLSVLWENSGSCPHSYTAAEQLSYAVKARQLRCHIEQKGILESNQLYRGPRVSMCMADNSSATVLTPEGRLGRCDSCMDGSIWGSIYSDEADAEVFRQWQERKPPVDACRTCAVYPQCIQLKKCPAKSGHCSPIEQERQKNRLRRAILETYRDWKTAGRP